MMYKPHDPIADYTFLRPGPSGQTLAFNVDVPLRMDPDIEQFIQVCQ